MKKFLIVSMIAISSTGNSQSFPFQDPQLQLEERVNDVVGRLTLEEKVAQMLNAAPAIPRLGIPGYDWWNEVLHGVARTPFRVTSYPQAIGMAATWDTNSLKMMAHYSALEGRAIHNKAIETNRTHERYLGLTYWTPNINIFRDPRWGRGQETYGEDPFLTAKLGAAFVRGLQGNDPKYLKAAACAKHFAVHSGPEPSRHSDNFNPTPYDLWDTYLPAFRELVTKANVAGVMCAYNAVNTQPCCASDLLMNDILRDQWNFTGYVTSDCWAIDDFFRYHKTHKDATAAAVDAVMHGTDIECGQTVYKTLLDAVKNGLISEAQLDISLKRLFTIRFRLGMFDPPSMVEYARTPFSVLEAQEHKAHALKMAQQSIVLLRNQRNVLPLKKNIRRIAVLGPNADNKIAVLGNYNGIPSEIVTVVEGLRKKLSDSTEIIYEKAINYTNDTLFEYLSSNWVMPADASGPVKAEYFTNEKLEGSPVLTVWEKDIDHYWTEGQAPAEGVPSIHFSARYTTTFRADKDEVMDFEIEGDDGYRLFINDSLYVDAWTRNRWGAKQLKLPVTAGTSYKMVVEFYQNEGNAAIKLRRGHYVRTDMKALIRRLGNVDAYVFVGGISPQLEGEEMRVKVPGFNGGDRTTILLPGVQTEFLKALQATGKPVVFVIMTGSAISFPWETQNIPAIINAWYGGQAAGTAIADVLFGDYNPSGRLPVTFYKKDSDLPAFGDYSMKNRTYRYFKGQPLYPFGFGLSYTTFRYDQVKVNPTVPKGYSLTIFARITNTGKREGEEVAQLYLTHLKGPSNLPLRALKGFTRVKLKPGESKTVRFILTPEELSIVDENGATIQRSGQIQISVGGGQPVKEGTSNYITVTTRVL